MRRTTLIASLLVLGLLACKDEKPSPLLEAARASTHKSEMSRPIPILTVRNLRASQSYFREVLGFKVDWEDGSPPDFGSVSRGDAVIFMCQRCQGNPGSWIMIFTRDVDRLHDELRRKDAIIKMPPTDMPWKLREMNVADRDGNVIRFASEIEH